MKTLLFLFLFFPIFVLAQTPEITTIVNNNSVLIKEDSTIRNCFANYRANVYINDTIINWYQIDTTEWWASCDCIFNLWLKLDSLQPKTYYVNIYYTHCLMWTPYDTVYEGSISFTINSLSYGNITNSYGNSDCLGIPYGIKEKFNSNRDNCIFYNLLGEMILNPTQGIYIIKCNNKNRKIIKL